MKLRSASADEKNNDFVRAATYRSHHPTRRCDWRLGVGCLTNDATYFLKHLPPFPGPESALITGQMVMTEVNAIFGFGKLLPYGGDMLYQAVTR